MLGVGGLNIVAACKGASLVVIIIRMLIIIMVDLYSVYLWP